MDPILDNPSTETPKYKDLFSHAAKAGAILAVISIAITVVVYVINSDLLANWKLGIFSMIVGVSYLIYAGISYRKQAGGYLPYGKAFQHAVVVLAVSGLIAFVFNGLMYSVIDPDLAKHLIRVSIDNAEQMLRGFGLPDDKIDEEIAKMEADLPKQFSLLGQLKLYLWFWIGYLVLGALFALITKKNPPETF